MNELRFALRQLRKSPGFTLVAVLTLAIGIGANTAIFTVVNAVLLKPLPFPQPEQLVALGGTDARETSPTGGLNSISFPDFFDFRAQNKSFAHLAVHRDRTFALSTGAEAQSVRGVRVSPDFFNVLGLASQLGRGFEPDEEAPGGGPGGYTVVLSHAFWHRHFKADRQALGSVLTLDGRAHTVVGVMPRGFQFPIETEPFDVYTTFAPEAESIDGGKPNTERRGSHSLQCVGRLKPGVTIQQANAELNTIAAALAQQYPDTNTNWGVTVVPLRENMVGDVSGGLYVLCGAVGCVLLIASANMANLLLARATVRGKEIALRAALGASRGRIIRQLLTESVLLAAIGGLCGLVFAAWGTDILVSLVPQNIPRISEIRLDGAVLGFTLLVSLATGVLFGLAPAFQASKLDLRSSLNEGGRGSAGGAKHRLRNALVIAEVALALLLLTGAGLLLKSFSRLSQVDPGLQTERVLSASITLPSAAYPRPENVVAFFDQLLPRLNSLPGVQSASTIFPLPLSGSSVSASFENPERPVPKGQEPDCPARIAQADYFRTVGVPLVRGRLFDANDQPNSKPVMLVNQRFAETFFPGQDVIGKSLKPGWSSGKDEPAMREIVGVVGNVKHRSLRAEFTPEMYMPATQLPVGAAALVIRTSVSDPAALTNAVRAELARTDASVPLTRVRPFDYYVGRSLARPRFNALLLSIFAGVALLLTAIGIYGVMAYSVAQRRQEIGIRMALGAQKLDVLRLVVGGGMKLTAAGVAIGLAAAFALTRLLETLLFGVKPFDALTISSVAFLLCLIALVACWVPARRAAGVNPLVALREG
ncbi:MAG: Acidobacterial duplicated orphan permease (function unknown) [uncultured Chthoniobacterales bacterium]|uniref:ABC transporter permease n=1 Tax=uncultured Chthoniobacterales bacterium TaxID=1836801 RepID=A0A6J4HRQ2_9BACT|nr:MAG: Acidobacterial duplicated orphan permease (function unknown) [uncultured Chthoniobacterales bacterium]